jgi:hypothetical protein
MLFQMTYRELRVFRRENTPFGITHSPMVQRSNTVQVGTASRGREPSLDSAPAAALSSLIRDEASSEIDVVSPQKTFKESPQRK